MSRKKEIHYFDKELHRKPLFWYARHFRASGAAVAGEITPGYSVLSKARIRYVYRLMPALRMVYVLRNPIERTWSAARRRLTTDTGRDLAEVGLDEMVSFVREQPTKAGTYRTMADRSAYVANIRRWLSVFPRDQLAVELFDDIAARPEALFRDVLRHIGVDHTLDLAGFPLRRRVNTNPQMEIPRACRAVLLEMYASEIEGIANQVDPRAASWLTET
jgi:hypothetical protein